MSHVIFLLSLHAKFEPDHSREWKGYETPEGFWYHWPVARLLDLMVAMFNKLRRSHIDSHAAFFYFKWSYTCRWSNADKQTIVSFELITELVFGLENTGGWLTQNWHPCHSVSILRKLAPDVVMAWNVRYFQQVRSLDNVLYWPLDIELRLRLQFGRKCTTRGFVVLAHRNQGKRLR